MLVNHGLVLLLLLLWLKETSRLAAQVLLVQLQLLCEMVLIGWLGQRWVLGLLLLLLSL